LRRIYRKFIFENLPFSNHAKELAFLFLNFLAGFCVAFYEKRHKSIGKTQSTATERQITHYPPAMSQPGSTIRPVFAKSEGKRREKE
jgi:hypothetical protein